MHITHSYGYSISSTLFLSPSLYIWCVCYMANLKRAQTQISKINRCTHSIICFTFAWGAFKFLLSQHNCAYAILYLFTLISCVSVCVCVCRASIKQRGQCNGSNVHVTQVKRVQNHSTNRQFNFVVSYFFLFSLKMKTKFQSDHILFHFLIIQTHFFVQKLAIHFNAKKNTRDFT